MNKEKIVTTEELEVDQLLNIEDIKTVEGKTYVYTEYTEDAKNTPTKIAVDVSGLIDAFSAEQKKFWSVIAKKERRQGILQGIFQAQKGDFTPPPEIKDDEQVPSVDDVINQKPSALKESGFQQV